LQEVNKNDEDILSIILHKVKEQLFYIII